MPPVVINTARGIFSHPNRLFLPVGSQIICRNTVHLAEGKTSRRRGWKRHAVLDNPASVMSEYFGSLVVLDGTTLKYDSDGLGTLLSWTGSFTPPTNTRMKFLETNGNLYWTTNRGVFVNDSLTGVPVRAGTPQGLDLNLTAVGVGGSWNSPDSQVGYRITWTHTDANGNAKQGAPSRQEKYTNSKTTLLSFARTTTTVTVTHTAHGYLNGDTIQILDSGDPAALPNGAYVIFNKTANTYDVTVPGAGGVTGTTSDGKAGNITLNFSIPGEIVVGDEYKVWRTDLTEGAGAILGANVPVGDDHREVTPLRKKVTSADIAAGTITVLDDNAPDFLGEDLYTNRNLSQANDRPPLAKFIVAFATHTFYFRCEQPHELNIQLINTTGLVAGTSSITITSGGTSLVYLASATEDISLRHFKLWTTEPVEQLNVEKTMKSLERVMNRDGNSLVMAFYNSGEDDPSGKLRIEKKTLGTSLFSVTASSAGVGDNFIPVLPTSGTTVKSDNNLKPNAYWRSKSGQPEAVPKLNSNLVGKVSFDIFGASKINEGILVWKEDGLFSISGQSDGNAGANFTTDDLDANAILKGEGTLTGLDNASFCHTSQGILRAGQGRPVIHSRPQIETELRRLATLSNFSSLAHAIAYETDREYILFHPQESTDTTCTEALVYNYASDAWDVWGKKISCGHVLSANGKLYVGHATEPRILQERKSYSVNADDFTDEEVDVTITAVGTANHPTLKIPGSRVPLVVSQITLTYAYDEPLTKGFLLSQGLIAWDWVDAVENLGGGSYRVTLRDLYSGWVTGAATVGIPIKVAIEWSPFSGGDPNVQKQFPYCSVYPEQGGGTFQLGFKADTQGDFNFVNDFIIERTNGFGLGPFGEGNFGDEEEDPIQTLRTWVPSSHQKCRALSVRLEANHARESLDILAVGLDMRPFSTKSERRPR